MIAVTVPKVGQDIQVVSIVQWLKCENDTVEKGETILTVESDKATFEVEAEQSGVLVKILNREGEEVEVLQPIAHIGQPEEQLDEEPADAKVGLEPAAASAATKDEKQPAQPGPEAAAMAPMADSSGGDEVVPFGKMRQSIAQRLTLSKQTIPHFYLMMDVDMTEAVQWRRSFNAQHGTRITITDLLIKATAVALRSFPRLNAHVNDQQTVVKKNINIGVAVSVEEGLLVPVIGDADQKSLQEISELSKKNIEAARRGLQKPGSTGTFTVSSLGMHGVIQFIPIINPPESAILAVGSVQSRVVPAPEGTRVREMVTLTLACDHRSVDGADAAGLLNKIKHDLEAIQDVQQN